jgi:hypothetical protein
MLKRAYRASISVEGTTSCMFMSYGFSVPVYTEVHVDASGESWRMGSKCTQWRE